MSINKLESTTNNMPSNSKIYEITTIVSEYAAGLDCNQIKQRKAELEDKLETLEKDINSLKQQLSNFTRVGKGLSPEALTIRNRLLDKGAEVDKIEDEIDALTKEFNQQNCNSRRQRDTTIVAGDRGNPVRSIIDGVETRFRTVEPVSANVSTTKVPAKLPARLRIRGAIGVRLDNGAGITPGLLQPNIRPAR